MTKPIINTIELNTPIKRGETEITIIELRTPTAGDLRGMKLMNIVEMEVSACQELVTRLSVQAVQKHEFDQLSLPDLTQIMTVVGGFFEGKNSAQA